MTTPLEVLEGDDELLGQAGQLGGQTVVAGADDAVSGQTCVETLGVMSDLGGLSVDDLAGKLDDAGVGRVDGLEAHADAEDGDLAGKVLDAGMEMPES